MLLDQKETRDSCRNPEGRSMTGRGKLWEEVEELYRSLWRRRN